MVMEGELQGKKLCYFLIVGWVSAYSRVRKELHDTKIWKSGNDGSNNIEQNDLGKGVEGRGGMVIVGIVMKQILTYCGCAQSFFSGPTLK